ncbi:multidrug-resistance type transporter aminotriazole resistance [Savitreella phatthalungensis]
MDMSFPAANLVISDYVPRHRQGAAASLVNTVLNYSISIGLGIAGTTEVHLNRGGQDPLRGFRAAFRVGTGLAGLGMILSIALVYLTRHNGPAHKAA